jgi:hypothetical protein
MLSKVWLMVFDVSIVFSISLICALAFVISFLLLVLNLVFLSLSNSSRSKIIRSLSSFLT